MSELLILHHPDIPSPEEIDTSRHFFEAFGDSETEVSAHYIVRYCQKQGNWNPFTFEEIDGFYLRDDGFTFNWLIDRGWVIENGSLYYVTYDFIKRLPRKESV